MKKEPVAFILIAALAGCVGNIAPKTTSEEDKAVKNLIDFYGGKCDYSTRIELLSNGSKHYFFNLKLSGSPIVISNPELEDILAAGIAYKFYCSLKTEANTFEQIRTEIVDSNGKSKRYNYDITVLKKVKSEMPKTSKVLELLKRQDYYGAVSQCDTSWIEDKKIYVDALKNAEKEYGILTEFRIFGFEFYKNTKGKTNLEICGTAISTKENHVMKIVTDPNDEALKIEAFAYKY